MKRKPKNVCVHGKRPEHYEMCTLEALTERLASIYVLAEEIEANVSVMGQMMPYTRKLAKRIMKIARKP